MKALDGKKTFMVWFAGEPHHLDVGQVFARKDLLLDSSIPL